jgi:DNA-binding beta-propeller fold protein YncE
MATLRRTAISTAAAALTAALLVPGPRVSAAPPAGPAAVGCKPGVATYELALPGHPFSVIATADERHVFVSLSSSNPRSRTGVGVLECTAGRYRLKHVIALESQPSGMALTHDGKLLLVADEDFTAFVDVQRAIAGQDAVLGYFQDVEGDDAGAVYVNVSPDDRFAFVSDENVATISVIDLARARANGFKRAAIVGTIPTGRAPIALTFTADGRYLLTTSQRALPADNFPAACKPEGQNSATATATNPPGEIIVVDVAKATTDPAHAAVARVPAGCSPVRMALSPDGATAWVTARNSNAVLGFSVAKLIAGDQTAQVANVEVGVAPVPVIVSPDGQLLLVGNSNRFGLGAAGNQSLTVLDPRAATTGGAAKLGQITVGKFPRELSRTRSGSTVFLANWDSNSVTVFDAARLRGLVH